MADHLKQACDVYGQLWQQAVAAFDSGDVWIDPFLKNRAGDRRRGVTLVARPKPEVSAKIESFLRQIARVVPGQHFYRPEEYHVTVLAVIPGSELWEASAHRLPDYLAVLDEVLRNSPTFSIGLRGVTASPDAIMIQGFPTNDSLGRLRDALRTEFSRSGLGGDSDRRYKIVGAHLTIARFSTRADWKALLSFLGRHRETEFGEMNVQSLQLIEGDWYASAETVRTLRKYPLH